MDRWARVVVGSGLVALGMRGVGRPKLAPAALFALGAVVLESALTRVCPLNAMLGVDTRSFDRNREARRLSERFEGASDLAQENVGAVQRLPADS